MSVSWTPERLAKFRATRARMIKEGTWRGGVQKGKKMKKRKYVRRVKTLHSDTMKDTIYFLRKARKAIDAKGGASNEVDLMVLNALFAAQGEL